VLFARDLPFWVGALGLAAIFSAEVSAADALLFMLATSFSQDIYKRFVNRAADDAQVVRWARVGAMTGGLLAFVMAIAVTKNVIDALRIFYTLLGVSLFVPVIAGLFSRAGGAAAALAAVAGGVALATAVQLTQGTGFVYGLTAPMWGIALAAVAYMMAAAVMPRRTS
jgi:SSS family solute:Na+ symporter